MRLLLTHWDNSGEGVDMNINGPINSMTHPAPSVASHVNASEIMDPVGVAVGETLGVNPTQTSNKYTANASTRTSFQNTRIQQERDEIIWSNHLKDFLHDKQTKKGQHRRISGPVGGEWAQCQRRYNRLNEQGKSTPLTAERKQSLDDIGFDWHDPPRPPTTPPTMDKKKIRQEKRHAIGWLKRLEDLRDYQTQHGHIRIPRKSCSLGEWVWRQRRFNRLNERGESTYLTAERKQLLDDIGFDWHPPPRELENMDPVGVPVGETLGITSTSGNVSENVDPVGAQIGETQGVLTPIQEGRPNENRNYDISDGSIVCPDNDNGPNEDVTHVNDITQQSSSASAPPANANKKTTNNIKNQREQSNEKWMKNYNALREYQTEKGHLLGLHKAYPLGKWVHNQRSHYKYKKLGKKTSLSNEREELLDELGFSWGEKVHETTQHPPEKQQELNDRWSNCIEDLHEYQTKYGKFRVPRKSGPFGKWVHKQREYNRLNEQGRLTYLTAERKQMLDELGSYWGPEKTPPKDRTKNQPNKCHEIIWSNRLKDLREFQTQHGHIRVPRKSGPLWRWVRNQRNCNRLNEEGQSTQLTTERKELLDEMGFIWNPEHRAEEHKRERGGQDTRKRKRLSGESGGASGSQAMVIKGEEQEGGGDTNLEPLLMSTPAQQKVDARYQIDAEKRKRLSGEPGGASSVSQVMAIKVEEQEGGDVKLEPRIVPTPTQQKVHARDHQIESQAEKRKWLSGESGGGSGSQVMATIKVEEEERRGGDVKLETRHPHNERHMINAMP